MTMQTKINFQIFDISLIKCMTVGLISPSLVATFFFKKILMEHVNAKVKDSLLLRNKNKRDGYLVSRKPAPRLNTHPFFG